MNADTTLDRPYKPLIDWLADQDIEYEVHRHDPAHTARATAAAEGVDPRTFANVVAVESPAARNASIVLDATDHLDLRTARHVLGDHRLSARVDRARCERACNVTYDDPAEETEAGPAWARS